MAVLARRDNGWTAQQETGRGRRLDQLRLPIPASFRAQTMEVDRPLTISLLTRIRLAFAVFLASVIPSTAVAGDPPSLRGHGDCAREIRALHNVHWSVKAALDADAFSQIERAAVAHGRGVLLWYAELQAKFLTEDQGLDRRRRSVMHASSAYLRCRHQHLTHLPEWNETRDTSVPTLWAFPGDLLISQNGRCAVLLRGEAAGFPGDGRSQSDRVGWNWSGKCRKGAGSGPGDAQVLLRSGETRAGLLGTGFARSNLRNGLMEGSFQLTDDSRHDPSWRNHYDVYRAGRRVARFRQIGDGVAIPIVFEKVADEWVWIDAAR